MKLVTKPLLILGILSIICSNPACSHHDLPERSGISFHFDNGDQHEAIIEVNGVIKEHLIDYMTNLGTEEAPAFFPIVSSHTIDGLPVENRTSAFNAFRSVDLPEYIALAKDFAAVHGYTLAEQTSTTDVEPFRGVFPRIRNFIKENHIDVGLLVELRKLTKTNSFSLIAATKAEGENLNRSLLALERDLLRQKGGANDVKIEKVETKSVAAVIAAVATATTIIKVGLKIIITLIENTMPIVDFNSCFVAYLNEADTNSSNYPTSGHTSETDTYTLTHKFWGVTYAQASFKVKADYMGTHTDMNEYYIPNIGLLVEGVKCVSGQHVEGEATFGLTDPFFETSSVNATMETIVVPGIIEIDYGDCCCYDYHCQLDFTVYGDKGIVVNSMNNWK